MAAHPRCLALLGERDCPQAAIAKLSSAVIFKVPRFKVIVGPLLAYWITPIPVETGTSPVQANDFHHQRKHSITQIYTIASIFNNFFPA